MMRIFVILAVLLCASVDGAESAAADESARVRVGLVLPLSGEWAFLGNGIRDGALLAKEDLERDNVSVTLLFEDNHGDLSASAIGAAKLVAQGRVDAFVSIISGVGKLLKPVAEKAGVLNIGICSDTDVADGKFSFINYLTAEQGAAKYVDHFVQTIGKERSVGVYAMNEAGFQKIVAEVSRLGKDKITFSFIEHFDKGVTDFKPMLLRNRSKQPDALLLLGLSPEIELVARQFRSLGSAAALTSIEGFGLSSDRAAFEGGWFVDSAVPNSAFRERFRKRYGREVTPGVGHAYDSVMLLGKAFGQGNAQPPRDRATAIQKFREISELRGVTGVLSVRSDGVIWGEASVKRIVNEQPVTVEQ